MTQHKSGWKAAWLGLLLALFGTSVVLMGTPKPEAKGPPAVAPPAQAGEYAGGDQCLACHDIEEAFKKNPHYKS